jgi:outer membrane protein TolC
MECTQSPPGTPVGEGKDSAIRESIAQPFRHTFQSCRTAVHATTDGSLERVEDGAMRIPTTSTMRPARVDGMRCRGIALHALALAAGLVALFPATGVSQQCGAEVAVVAPATGQATGDGRGVRGILDTTVGIVPCLSLETIIARTLVHSPAVAGAIGTVRDAAAARQVATLGAYLPTLVLNGITGKSNQSLTSATSTTDTAKSSSSTVVTTYGVGVTGLVPVFTGGRRRDQARQAKAMSRAADAGLVLQRYATIFTATQGYLDVLRAHELVRVAADQLAQASLGLDYVLRRQAAGTAMTADVLSAQLAVSTARQAQLAALDTLNMTAAALGRLVGANGLVDAEPTATLEPRPLVLDDATIVSLAVSSSPSVLNTQAVASADSAGVRAAKTLYIPTIAAGAGYNWGTRVSFVGGLRPGWIVELVTAFPLFDGFVREQTITQAKVASDVATVTALDTRRLAGATAVELLGNLHVAAQSIEQSRESVRFATENLRVFRLRYNAGIATILDVLTAQTSLVQAELSLVSARFSYRSTRAALEALLGRRV